MAIFFQPCHFKFKDFDGAADSFLAGLSQSGKKKRNLDTNLEHEVGVTKRMDLGFERDMRESENTTFVYDLGCEERYEGV